MDRVTLYNCRDTFQWLATLNQLHFELLEAPPARENDRVVLENTSRGRERGRLTRLDVCMSLSSHSAADCDQLRELLPRDRQGVCALSLSLSRRLLWVFGRC